MAKIISLEEKTGQQAPKLPLYDPQKGYTWNPKDDFVLSGNEFGLLYQVVKTDVSAPGGVSTRDKMAAFNLLEDILKQAVEAGVATEIKNEAPN